MNTTNGNTIPAPSPITKAHSDQLVAKIRQRIVQDGPISFAQYMQMALYQPGLGYYSAGAQKFGESGDFVTAPEISSLFGRCLARQAQQVMHEVQSADILEFGAGSGKLAADVLLELQELDSLPERYLIMKVSADLRDRQRKYLQGAIPNLVDRVVWLDQLPDSFQGVILANEVLDAMPVHKFIWQDGALSECYVDIKDDQFYWRIAEPAASLVSAVDQLQIEFADQYESEINCFLPGWIASLAAILSRGAILLVDYGFPRHEYYHHDRSMGTLMCHYRHHAHTDPLVLAGIQDITAHVDFTAVAEAASDHDLTVAGYTQQASFLINCGLTEMMNDITNDVERFNLVQQIKTLTLPSEMGELFKVMALTKQCDDALLGFSHMNQLERL